MKIPGTQKINNLCIYTFDVIYKLNSIILVALGHLLTFPSELFFLTKYLEFKSLCWAPWGLMGVHSPLPPLSIIYNLLLHLLQRIQCNKSLFNGQYLWIYLPNFYHLYYSRYLPQCFYHIIYYFE